MSGQSRRRRSEGRMAGRASREGPGLARQNQHTRRASVPWSGWLIATTRPWSLSVFNAKAQRRRVAKNGVVSAPCVLASLRPCGFALIPPTPDAGPQRIRFGRRLGTIVRIAHRDNLSVVLVRVQRKGAKTRSRNDRVVAAPGVLAALRLCVNPMQRRG